MKTEPFPVKCQQMVFPGYFMLVLYFVARNLIMRQKGKSANSFRSWPICFYITHFCTHRVLFFRADLGQIPVDACLGAVQGCCGILDSAF